MATTNKRPLHKIQVGRTQASIWEQVPDKGKSFLTVTFTQSYKTKSDKWKNANNSGKST